MTLFAYRLFFVGYSDAGATGENVSSDLRSQSELLRLYPSVFAGESELYYVSHSERRESRRIGIKQEEQGIIGDNIGDQCYE